MKRFFTFRSILSLLALIMVVGVSSTAKADQVLLGTALAPGGAVTPVTTTLVAPITVLAVTGPQLFSNTFIGGVARVAVARESNGFLTFYYQVQSTGGSSVNDDINQINAANFAGFTTNVAQITNGSLLGNGFVDGTVGVGANSALRNAPSGSTVNFVFGTGDGGSFMPGETSYVFSIQTNATQFTPGFFTVSNGIVVNLQGFSPSAIPEPTSMLLLGTGLVGIVGLARRKFKK